jgi:hypothetical protein
MKNSIITLIIIVLLTSCAGTAKLSSSEHASEREVQTRIQIQTQIDSVMIYKRDSIYIREKNDTVFVEKWHTLLKYRDRIRTDTLRVSDTVTINHSVTETVEVEVNKLTGWQVIQIAAGKAFLLALLCAAVFLFTKYKFKKL